MQYDIPTDEEIAAKAHALILEDLRIYNSVAELAERVGTNSFTLKTAFKKYYHISVFDFSRQQRIEKAKEILLETNYTLYTIAKMVGYSKGPNFQIAFRTVVGCNPGVWRKTGECPGSQKS